MSPKAHDPSAEAEYPDAVMEALERIEDLKMNGKHQESIAEAEKLLVRDPDCVPALEELADNYVSLNKFSQAEKACERALLLDKESFTAYYIRGFIRSQEQNWVKSIEFLRQANRLHSNNPEILRCLGWSLFNAGKRTQGIVILERALNLDPENSLTLCDLGVAYLQVKNFEKSIELLKRALELDPDNKRVQECYRAAQGLTSRFSPPKDARLKRRSS